MEYQEASNISMSFLLQAPRTANVCNVVGPHEGRDVFSGGRRVAGVL